MWGLVVCAMMDSCASTCKWLSMLLFDGERQRHKIMPKIISCNGMDGPREGSDHTITVVTCNGDINDPTFPKRLRKIICKLKNLVSDDKKPFNVTKVEPWNSVRVTFSIPRNAAQRLRQLAERGDNALRELGILSVQIEGDQVITLTLANSFNENYSQILIGKTSDGVRANSVDSTANSSYGGSPIIHDAIATHSHVNNSFNNTIVSTSNSAVSSIASSNSFDLIGSPSNGPNVEATRKNIVQYLSQGTAVSNTKSVLSGSATAINSDYMTFKSPNVVAPANNEPIPFITSSSSSLLSSSLPSSSPSSCSSSVFSPITSSSCATPVTFSAYNSNASVVSARMLNQAVSSVSMSGVASRVSQSNVIFPFSSMQQNAIKQGMNLPHYTSVHQPTQVNTASIRLPLTNALPNALPNSSAHVSSTSPPIGSPQSALLRSPTIFNNFKISQPQQQQQTQAQTVAFAVAAAAANRSSASANVALSSPLLVNLLQSDASGGHMKVIPPATAVSETQKRKPRKVRKPKEKSDDSDNNQLTDTTLHSTPPPPPPPYTLSIVQPSISIALTPNQTVAHYPLPLPSNQLSQSSSIEPPSSRHNMISIPIGSSSRFHTNIEPDAQGQPRVARAGHLTLQSKPQDDHQQHPQQQNQEPQQTPIKSPIYAPIRNQILVTSSQASCSKSFATVHSQMPQEKSSLIATTAVASAAKHETSESRNLVQSRDQIVSSALPVSPSSTRMTGKTKHLINPFTGHLEPMLSDDEEDDRNSPENLFQEMDAISDNAGGQSERSLSDNGSKLSDTDSGLGKSGTDVSSQFSDTGNGDTPNDNISLTLNEHPNAASEKFKLRLKVDSKSDQQFSSDPAMAVPSLSSTTLLSSKSHLTRQKQSHPFVSNSGSHIMSNHSIIAEPRVPPLHISIRGPNSAVVVSNRRESTGEIDTKSASTLKKSRVMRTTRAVSAESTLVEESVIFSKNQRRKLQREQRFMSGGGIITSINAPSDAFNNINDLLKESSIDTTFMTNISEYKALESRVNLELVNSVSSSVQNNAVTDESISLNMHVPLRKPQDDDSSVLVKESPSENGLETKHIDEQNTDTNDCTSNKSFNDHTIASPPLLPTIVEHSETKIGENSVINSKHGDFNSDKILQNDLNNKNVTLNDTNEEINNSAPVNSNVTNDSSNQMSDQFLVNASDAKREFEIQSANNGSNETNAMKSDDFALKDYSASLNQNGDSDESSLSEENISNGEGQLKDSDYCENSSNEVLPVVRDVKVDLTLNENDKISENQNDREKEVKQTTDEPKKECDGHKSIDMTTIDMTTAERIENFDENKQITSDTTKEAHSLSVEQSNPIENDDTTVSHVSNNLSDSIISENTSDNSSNGVSLSSANNNDEGTKQSLQIVIATSVPSIVTTTTTTVIPQLRPSSIDSGGRLTFITFKPNLNSPNQTNSQQLSADKSNSALSNARSQKTVPIKLLTIPSGSGGITVRSATNKLVELINSSSASPVSPLSPNTLNSCGSPLPMSASSPVRLLVSEVTASGSNTQNTLTSGSNSIRQLVVVKSVVMANQSPAIKIVPARNPTLNSSPLVIPVKSKSPENPVDSIEDDHNKMPILISPFLQHQSNTNSTINDNSVYNDSATQNCTDKSHFIDSNEPVDLSVSFHGESVVPSDKISDVKESVEITNELNSDSDDGNDNKLHSVAYGDHNYIMNKSSDGIEIEESILNLSNATDKIAASIKETVGKLEDDDYPEASHIHTHNFSHQKHDVNSRPNKRKCSENAAELIKACMGLEDAPKRNSTIVTYSILGNTSSPVARAQSLTTKPRVLPYDHDSTIPNDQFISDAFVNRPKNSRIRKGKLNETFTTDVYSSDDELSIHDDLTKGCTNKPRLRTNKPDITAPGNQSVKRKTNCRDSKRESNAKIPERTKRARDRDRDQTTKASLQRSTRKSRDHIMLDEDQLNLNDNADFSGPSHHMGNDIEIPNDSSNNYNCESTPSATSSLITSSLLFKRKTRVNSITLTTNSEQSDCIVPTKRRRITKDSQR